jgi:hypothetical protein
MAGFGLYGATRLTSRPDAAECLQSGETMVFGKTLAETTLLVRVSLRQRPFSSLRAAMFDPISEKWKSQRPCGGATFPFVMHFGIGPSSEVFWSTLQPAYFSFFS